MFKTRLCITDMPKVQIDTDIRQLFAIGKLDDFEKIRKENELSQSTLRGMGARVKDRIKKLRTMSASEVSRCFIISVVVGIITAHVSFLFILGIHMMGNWGQ